MKKRLFIAINLPDDVKQQIQEIVHNIKNLFDKSVRFLEPENWHLTITFLGYQPEEAIPQITESIKLAAKKHSGILQNTRMLFDKIILAPPGRAPRMIWLCGAKETSKNLALIKNNLENNLVKNGVKFRRENRPYNAHLTLARFNSISRNYADYTRNYAEILRNPASSLPSSLRPQVGVLRGLRQSAFLAFRAKSIDLMESHLKRTGAEYKIIESVALTPNF